MGRKKLNRTKQELNEINRKYRMRSYWKHVDKERDKAKKRYWKNKRTLQYNK